MLAAIAGFVAYGPALSGPFLFDDLSLAFAAPDAASWPFRAWVSGMRPVLMFSYWLNFQFAGARPYSYHVVNVLLHVANSLLVYLLLARLLARAGEQGWRLQTAAVFAAGLFLLHPLQTESVAYAASRSESLAAFLSLAAMTVFMANGREPVTFRRAVAVLALYGAAVLSKEQAAVLPAWLLLTDYFWNPGLSWEGIRRNWRLYVLFPAILLPALAMVGRVLAAADTAGFRVHGLTWLDYFWTECRAIWVYVRLYALPYGQNVDPEFRISRGPLDHGALIGLLALAAAVAGAWWLRRRVPLAAYGVLVFLLLVAPTSSFIPIADPIAERRVYLPSIGLLLVITEFLRRWRWRISRLAGILAAVLIIDGALTWRRSQVWASATALWEDTVGKSPGKMRPHFQLAYSYYELGRCDDACRFYEKAASLEKPDYRLLVDWALALDCSRRPADALAKLTQAAEMEATGHVYSQIGMMYAKQGRHREALEALARAEKLDPQFMVTYVYRGNVYFNTGEYSRAAAEYRRAIRIDPSYSPAVDGLRKAEAELRR